MIQDDIKAKIRPFFQELERRREIQAFDSLDWGKAGTAAFEFAQVHLTAKERKLLCHVVYGILLSPVRVHHMTEWDDYTVWRY